MNIVELRDRLTEIIEENKSRGWGNRNLSDVVIRQHVSKRITEYYFIRYASSAWIGLEDDGKKFNVFELNIMEQPCASYGHNRK